MHETTHTSPTQLGPRAPPSRVPERLHDPTTPSWHAADHRRPAQPASAAMPPRPTKPPPGKTEDDWLQEFQTKLNVVKPKMEKVVKVEGLDKTKRSAAQHPSAGGRQVQERKEIQGSLRQELDDLNREVGIVTNSTPAIKQMLRATDADKSTFAKQGLLDTIIAELPKEVDMTEVQRIIDNHRKAVPVEIKAFAKFCDFQDVLEIKDEVKRKAALLEVGNAIASAKTREKELAAALKAIRNGANDPNLSEDQKKPFRNAFALVMDMCSHIPEEFLSVWTPNFSASIDTLTKDPAEKKKSWSSST